MTDKKTRVYIKENSWIAGLAAKKLGSPQVAIVIGRTIHLSNVSRNRFLKSRKWLIHELKHVDQYEQHGFVSFLFKYVLEHIRQGYHNNKYELEARAAETDDTLLYRFEIAYTKG